MNAAEALKECPQRIRDARAELWKQKDILARLEHEQRSLEASMYAKVSQALNAEGKKAFTSDTARDAETKSRLWEDPGAADLRSRIRDVRVLIDRVDSTLDYHRDVQANARVVLLTRSPLDFVFTDEAPT